jgi:hypothetical protein
LRSWTANLPGKPLRAGIAARGQNGDRQRGDGREAPQAEPHQGSQIELFFKLHGAANLVIPQRKTESLCSNASRIALPSLCNGRTDDLFHMAALG